MKKLHIKIAVAVSSLLAAIGTVVFAANMMLVTTFFDANGNSVGVLVEHCHGGIDRYGVTDYNLNHTTEAIQCN